MAFQNVVYRVEGRKLILEIDLDGDLGLSSTRFSRLVATGSATIPGEGNFKLSVNGYRPLTKSQLLEVGRREAAK